MRKFAFIFIVMNLCSLPLYAMESKKLSTKLSKVQVRKDLSYCTMEVQITDVVGDGNCCFYSAEITRAKFYKRLRALNPFRKQIIAAIMKSLKRPNNEYADQLNAWFDYAVNRSTKKHWVNTAGVNLMSVTFNTEILTYSYALIDHEFDENILMERSHFLPLDEIQILLNDNNLLSESLDTIHLINIDNIHWNQMIIISQSEDLPLQSVSSFNLISDSESSSSEEIAITVNVTKEEEKKEAKKRKADEEENSENKKRKTTRNNNNNVNNNNQAIQIVINDDENDAEENAGIQVLPANQQPAPSLFSMITTFTFGLFATWFGPGSGQK